MPEKIKLPFALPGVVFSGRDRQGSLTCRAYLIGYLINISSLFMRISIYCALL
jgi:hypothetical protein